MAEREGFEPPIRLPVCRISSAVHSTTLPPLRGARAGQDPASSRRIYRRRVKDTSAPDKIGTSARRVCPQDRLERSAAIGAVEVRIVNRVGPTGHHLQFDEDRAFHLQEPANLVLEVG
jgi:hypothetical protein